MEDIEEQDGYLEPLVITKYDVIQWLGGYGNANVEDLAQVLADLANGCVPFMPKGYDAETLRNDIIETVFNEGEIK
jgi:hypothetical protein